MIFVFSPSNMLIILNILSIIFMLLEEKQNLYSEFVILHHQTCLH